jgi:hypothetical protein
MVLIGQLNGTQTADGVAAPGIAGTAIIGFGALVSSIPPLVFPIEVSCGGVFGPAMR